MNSNRKPVSLRLGCVAITVLVPPAVAVAQSTNPPARLPEVRVEAESESAGAVQGPFLPPVQGTKINAGKKTSVLDLDELPEVSNNNYRQALAQTPGLLLSEETSPLVSLGYRGLPPHRAQFTQMLKDGLPIHADMFGYPEAYYTPPLDTVDRLEFLHGGAALLYGPQPGGALNYVTHRPRTDKPFSARTQNLFGSDNYFSTFNSVDGTVDRLGYYSYFNYRRGDGFREANSDFDVYAGSAKLVLDADQDSRWILNFDGYAEEHGEPGGLTFATGPDAVNYREDREAASRFFDRFCLDRYFGSLAWERDFTESTFLSVQAWGGYYKRYSQRQRGGGFGTLPTGPDANSNTIELQEFYTEGLEGRLRHDWTLGQNSHTLAGGVMLYHNGSPRVDKRGAAPDAEDGMVRNKSQRDTYYTPVFVENRFNFGKFSATPGLRLENIWQSVDEEVNVAKTAAGTPLGDESEYSFVPLVGLGLEYDFTPKIAAYGNVSQAYRPTIFTEAVPNGANSVINGDLEESSSWQYEVGFRGNPLPYVSWDASIFLLEIDNQVGTVALPGGVTSIENVGRARHRGVEASLEFDLVGGLDAWRRTDHARRLGSFSLYANAMFLDAEFVSGPQEGNTPQYAPDYLLRAGAIYRWRDRVKAALLGTFVDDHYADDSNTGSFFIPAYMSWDLTLEARVWKGWSVVAGVNNLFDEDYYARIRGDGIDPAYGRNYYAGVALAF